MTSSTVSFPAGIPLGTKLNAPVSARRRIARELLVQRLVSPEPRRLTLLDAPAGWGKTSLLAEWGAAPTEARSFAWFTIDRTDNDPVRFWAYVIEALRARAPAVGSASLAALGVSGTDPVEVVLPPLINELAGLDERVVLVLDDYHLIESEEVHAGVTFLLAHLPATFELAIATRHDPPLPLASLRAQGELLELRAAELRFDEAEAEQLLRAAVGEGLDAADVERLVVRTEGWAAGLYLAALSLAGRSDRSAFIQGFAGDDRHIVDYLGGEVLDDLEPATRSFLLRTSILERLSAQLCDHLLETIDARRRLLEIERANLFLVPLDGRREWYRYHHLFRELLRQELERSDPEEVRALHRRAADWLAANGVIDDAIRHALSAGDGASAARLVAEQWREPFNRGELATVDRWLDDLPEAVVASDPDLCLARAWVLMDRGRAREAEQWLRGAEAGHHDLVPHAVLSFKLGKIGEAERIARDALESAPVDSSLGLGVAHCILGVSLYYRGELDEAASSLEEAERLSVSDNNRLARIYALGYLALIRLEAGDEEAARLAAAHALELGGAPPASEHFVTAAARLARGRLDRDDAALEHAVALSRRGGAAIEVGASLLGLGEVRRDTATLAEARAALQGCEDPGRLPALIERAEIALRGRRPGPRRVIAGDLSDRELAVLQLLPGDSSLREIASALYVSLNTVKTHSRSIYRKLDASSRQEAVERGRELGLL
jgi:LuxR family maltose regulon positive regulatory protein